MRAKVKIYNSLEESYRLIFTIGSEPTPGQTPLQTFRDTEHLSQQKNRNSLHATYFCCQLILMCQIKLSLANGGSIGPAIFGQGSFHFASFPWWLMGNLG